MNNLVITNKGQELMTGLIAGTNHATFTEIVTSDCDYSGTELTELETVGGVKQTSLISEVNRTDNNVVQIISYINNTAVTTGYYIKIVGIYAVDDAGNKILYAVTTETDNPIYMPAFGGKTESSVDFIFNVKVSNSDNVNLIVDPSGVPSRAEFNAVKEKLEHLQCNIRKEIARRLRDPDKPDYGAGGGGDAAGVTLITAEHTGNAEVTVVISGKEYDGKNISRRAEDAPSGTLIIKEEN